MSCLENSVGNIIWNIVEIGVGKDTSFEIFMAHVHMNIFLHFKILTKGIGAGERY